MSCLEIRSRISAYNILRAQGELTRVLQTSEVCVCGQCVPPSTLQVEFHDYSTL